MNSLLNSDLINNNKSDISNDISDFLKKCIKNYDDQNYKYKKYIKNKKHLLSTLDYDIKNTNPNEITFNFKNSKKIFNYELLGIYDYSSKIWIWGWVINNNLNLKINISKYLLEYGLKLDINYNDDNYDINKIIKPLLLNSRIQIDNFIQLDINLSIYFYLIKNNIYFIYIFKKYLDNNKKKFVIYYLLIINNDIRLY